MNRNKVLYGLIVVSIVVIIIAIILDSLGNYWYAFSLLLNALGVMVISVELLFTGKWRQEERLISLILASGYTAATLVSMSMIYIDVDHVAFYGVTGNVINFISAVVFWLLFWLAKGETKNEIQG
ncbi:MAG: hypothetical protein Q8Q23_01365 [bacterium]|nr:hypothetical protein [bacterium]